jgi:uncharacterized membrane protein YdbT with pleckstrin-like domain
MIKLEKDEKIILEIRKHWLIYALESLGLFIAFVAPLFLILILKNIGVDISFHPANKIGELSTADFVGYNITFIIFLYSVWAIFLWIWAFVLWTDYYLDVWVVTDKKIVDVEQFGLFNRKVSIVNLDKIQDVNFNISGFITTMLNIGSISVQTAGIEKLFTIRGIHDPIKIHAQLSQTLSEYKKTHYSNFHSGV